MTEAHPPFRVAVVTGGAGEIGLTTARSFLSEGYSVVITGRTRDKLVAAVETLRSEVPDSGPRIAFFVVDSSSPEELAHFASFIEKRFGAIDVLVNNAGSAGLLGPISALTAPSPAHSESLLDSLRSLFVGPWLMTKAMLPFLRHGASVVHVSTIFSRTPYYGRAAYSVPKAALNALSQIMSNELGLDDRKIRVNTVLPGPVQTDRINRVFAAMDNMRGAEPGALAKEVKSSMRLSVEGETAFVPKKDVAATVLFLAGAASSSLSGQQVEVTLGMNVGDDVSSRLPVDLSAVKLNPAVDRFVWIVGTAQLAELSTAVDRVIGPGVNILVTLDASEVTRAKQKFAHLQNVEVLEWNTDDPKRTAEIEIILASKRAAQWSVLVFLEEPEANVDSQLMKLEPETVFRFVERELARPMALASLIDRALKAHDLELAYDPSVIFLDFGAQSEGLRRQEIRKRAITQLLRIWRDEAKQDVDRKRRLRSINAHQLFAPHSGVNVKTSSYIECASLFAVSHSRTEQIDLQVDRDVVFERIAEAGPASLNQIHPGVYSDCVAVITGGSEGIGGAITRQLARAGVRIVIAERHSEKLKRIHAELVQEIKTFGYQDPENRVLTLAYCDVTLGKSLRGIVSTAMAAFGRVDFLINNAGLVGAEDMAVDIDSDMWNQTLYGNLISNYQLILDVLPIMREQKFGHIINMSSYFGGTRHGAVPYTNRSDYAVSKAGQIALAQALADAVGPEIQINALAPGPVEGARLNGTGGRPGLYQRRARLLNENKRLNQIYVAVVKSMKAGSDPNTLIDLLALNDIDRVQQSAACSASLDSVLSRFQQQHEGEAAGRYVLTKSAFTKLIQRLGNSGVRLKENCGDCFVDAPEPFFSLDRIEREAAEIKNRMIASISLKRMPTDAALASEVLSTLAHRTLTGEVIYPTCGFKFPGFQLGECFRYDGTNIDAQPLNAGSLERAEVNGEPAFLIGDAYPERVIELARAAAQIYGKVAIATFSEQARAEFAKLSTPMTGAQRIHILKCDGLHSGKAFEKCQSEFGMPGLVLSFPMTRLPNLRGRVAGNFGELPKLDEFIKMVDGHITNHFEVVKRASMVPNCRIAFLPATSTLEPGKETWIKLICETLRPLTLAAGKECAHLLTGAHVFQFGADLASGETGARIVLAATLPQAVGNSEKLRMAV